MFMLNKMTVMGWTQLNVRIPPKFSVNIFISRMSIPLMRALLPHKTFYINHELRGRSKGPKINPHSNSYESRVSELFDDRWPFDQPSVRLRSEFTVRQPHL